ncbi:GAF and ANTAR domain-containing protein [Nocardioides sp. CPCC 206347]|uniref:GAF and ANTAR domain-containing protein n=1 Tax=unclassified Nocardioides TaxID=2615069 RepID=UPI00361FA597
MATRGKTASGILASLLSSDQEPATILSRLCDDCARDIPVTGVGLALINDDGHQGVVAATDGLAAAMEDLQFSLGEGPCIDASRHRRPVLQPELARTAMARWPAFGPEALDAGIEAIFAFPLQVGAIRIGILDLYRDQPGSLAPEAVADALTYADAAVQVVLHLQSQVSPGGGLPPQLAHPMENRAEVHQATGFVSVVAAVTLAEALQLLRAHAYAAERPILLVARDVLAGTLRIGSLRSDDE